MNPETSDQVERDFYHDQKPLTRKIVLSKRIDAEFENLREMEKEKQQFEEPKKRAEKTKEIH